MDDPTLIDIARQWPLEFNIGVHEMLGA